MIYFTRSPMSLSDSWFLWHISPRFQCCCRLIWICMLYVLQDSNAVLWFHWFLCYMFYMSPMLFYGFLNSYVICPTRFKCCSLIFWIPMDLLKRFICNSSTFLISMLYLLQDSNVVIWFFLDSYVIFSTWFQCCSMIVCIPMLYLQQDSNVIMIIWIPIS